jgi:CheY-like chemotaxis protein
MKLGKAKLIFIADDDALMSEALADYLMPLGPRAITKYMTGEECLRAVGETPDFVIIDYF